jgi:hypothetical protein
MARIVTVILIYHPDKRTDAIYVTENFAASQSLRHMQALSLRPERVRRCSIPRAILYRFTIPSQVHETLVSLIHSFPLVRTLITSKRSPIHNSGYLLANLGSLAVAPYHPELRISP